MCEPRALVSVKTSDGEELPVPEQSCSQVMRKEVAQEQLVDVLTLALNGVGAIGKGDEVGRDGLGALMDELVRLALKRQRQKGLLHTSFETNLLQNAQLGGAKGGKKV